MTISQHDENSTTHLFMAAIPILHLLDLDLCSNNLYGNHSYHP